MNKQKQMAEMLLDIKAVAIKGTNDLFTWASGIKSPIYCDNRLTMGYPKVRDFIAESFKEIIQKEFQEVQVIAGTATAGIPHSAWVSQKMELPMVYVRSSAKGHGKQNVIEGKISKGDKVVLIEDLFSTGGSSMKAVKALQEFGCEVLGVVAIFSYKFKQLEDSFAEEGIPYRTLTDYDILLSVAVEKGYLNKDELELLGQWNKNPRMFTE